MNRLKSTAASQESKEEFGDGMNTSLNGQNIVDKISGENPQMSSTLVRSSAAANGSNFRLPVGSSVESGTLLEQFNQLMNQQRLLWFGGLNKLQRKLEESDDKILKKYEGWQLKVSEMRSKANKTRQVIEALQADNRAMLASIASTSGIVSDGDHSSLLTDGHCSASSPNQVLPESPSNVSPPEIVQSPDGINNNLEHLDARMDIAQQLNNEDTSTNVADVTSNIENGDKNSGADFGEQEQKHSANYSNDRTVAQASDLFSPSTSTGRRSNRIDVSFLPSQTVQSFNVSHIKQEHLDERADNERNVDDPSTNTDHGYLNKVDAERYEVIQQNQDNGELSQSAANENELIDNVGGNLGSEVHVKLDVVATIVDQHNASVANDLIISDGGEAIDASNRSSDNESNLPLINEHEVATCHKSTQEASTSGLRSSNRNLIQTKVFGVDQPNQVKCDKRKNETESSEAAKRIKPENDDDSHQEDECADKVQVVTLEVNCTEPGCKSVLNSNELWKQHLWTCHGLVPYKQLEDNVRHNQHGQTKYLCTECNAMAKSQASLNQHWRHYHQPGKFECSVCAFVANFRSEVFKHQQQIHRFRRFQCPRLGCNKAFKSNRDLERHERSHNGGKPFACVWDNFQYT